jgi:hypothetical protein
LVEAKFAFLAVRDPSLRLKSGSTQDDAPGELEITHSRMSLYVSRVRLLNGVIPKSRVFTSGARDLAPIAGDRRSIDFAPSLRQVVPMRVHRLDESYLLAAPRSLDFFLAIDRRIGIEKALEVSESRQIIAAGETGNQFVFVLKDTAAQITRDASV